MSSSNGILWDEHQIDWIKGFSVSLQIKFDSVCPYTWEQIKRSKFFALLKGKDIKVNIE